MACIAQGMDLKSREMLQQLWRVLVSYTVDSTCIIGFCILGKSNSEKIVRFWGEALIFQETLSWFDMNSLEFNRMRSDFIETRKILRAFIW